ncbi:glycosyltransferase [Frondihabitans australicus]|uniref:Galactosyltransferase-like protein n=1 Tax=Frondihabitans australicus TaxID=386892 RepID=A0A495IFM5_9MICO|nr:glycosyltransferase family 2 protein [Frondihabitans australicus]RKR74813.1 galactosyltransferase-like protein [Frondihabitans australicus]
MVGRSRVVTRRGFCLPENDWSLLNGQWPEEPPFVTAIVAHYEQQTELDRTLLALRRQDHPASHLEIVVVDDGSSTPPEVPADVRLVVQEDRGFRLAAARNAGAAVARGDVLCFLDADTAPERGYVRGLTRLPALAPDVVAVGRRRHASLSTVSADALLEDAAPPVELEEPRWLRDAYRRSRNLLDADDLSYRHVIGAVIACDAAFFAETNGFDESFTEYGGEDWEWAYRAWLSGALLAHVPEAVAWHDGPDWAARPEAAHAAANAQALRLSERIPVPGSGPRGLRGPLVDVAITVPEGADPTAAEWFVTRDSLAADLPLAALPGDPRSRAKTRIVVDVHRPMRVAPGALRKVVEKVAAEQLHSFSVIDAVGDPVCTVTATRAAARAARWQRFDLFPARQGVVAGIDRIGDDIDVGAYLGGWG